MFVSFFHFFFTMYNVLTNTSSNLPQALIISMVIKTEENQTDSIFIATYQTMKKRKKRKRWDFSIPRGVVVLGMHGGVVGKAMIGMGGSVVHTIKAW